MLDFSFGELLLIAVIGLIVLGPERLPSALATVARWLAVVRKSVNGLKTELQHELEIQSLKDQLNAAKADMRSTELALSRVKEAVPVVAVQDSQEADHEPNTPHTTA